jgi:hypothetical protein
MVGQTGIARSFLSTVLLFQAGWCFHEINISEIFLYSIKFLIYFCVT